MIKYRTLLKEIKQHAGGVTSTLISGIRRVMSEPPVVPSMSDTLTVTITGRDDWENRTYFYLNLKDETSQWSIVDTTNNVIIADSKGAQNNIEYYDDDNGRIYFELVQPDATECTYVVSGTAEWFGIDYYYQQDDAWEEIKYPEIKSEMTIDIHNYSSKIESYSFYCENTLITLPKDLPEHVNDYSWFLAGCNMFTQDISNWDLSNATDIDYMFRNCTSFNQDLSGWNVGNVKYMYCTFDDCSAFNQPLNNWNVSNVVTMNGMFNSATNFNQPLDKWNVGNVTDMRRMFQQCPSFNQDLSSWCVMKIPTIPDGFHEGMYISTWVLPKPIWGTCLNNNDGVYVTPSDEETEIINNFDPITFTINDFKNQSKAIIPYIGIDDVVDWLLYNDTNNKIIASSFKRSGKGIYLNAQDINSVMLNIDMAHFNNNTKFKLYTKSRKQILFSEEMNGWSSMVNGAITINDWSADIDSVRFATGRFNFFVPEYLPKNMTDLSRMFDQAGAFNHDISMWDVSNVTDMSAMFSGARLFNQDLSSWCVSNITTSPDWFDVNTDNWTLPKPVWGTCPVEVVPEDPGVPVPDAVDAFIFTVVNDDSNAATYTNLRVEVGHLGKPWQLFENDILLASDDYGHYELVNKNVYDNRTFVTIFNKGNTTCQYKLFTDRAYVELDTPDAHNYDTVTARHITIDQFSPQVYRYSFYPHTIGELNVPAFIPAVVTETTDMFRGCTTFNSDISNWDVSNITSMEGMFYDCTAFNQDLSRWCVTTLKSKPYQYDSNTTAWVKSKPVWGTCPPLPVLPQLPPGGKPLEFNTENWLSSEELPLKLELTTTSSDWYLVSETTLMASSLGYVRAGASVSTDNGVVSLNLATGLGDTHTYELYGTFNSVRLSDVKDYFDGEDYSGHIKVTQFGDSTSHYLFNISNALLDVPPELPPAVTSMQDMFKDCDMFYSDISNWDVSNVTNMDGMFDNCLGFNQDLSTWCVSTISSEPPLFSNNTPYWTSARPQWGTCPSNPDVFAFEIDNTLNTTSRTFKIVVDPADTFTLNSGGQTVYKDGVIRNPYSLTVVDDVTRTINLTIRQGQRARYELRNCNIAKLLLTVNESTVTTAKIRILSMSGSILRYQFHAHSWPLSVETDLPAEVLSTDSMFKGCRLFNSDISNWDVSNVTNMFAMFYGCRVFNQPLNTWDTSNVTNMGQMFFYTLVFNQAINSWNVGKVTNMDNMFEYAGNFNQDLSGWDVSLMSVEPWSFSQQASSWILPKPIWGTSGAVGLEEILPSSLHFTTVTDTSSPTELPLELTLTPRNAETEWQIYESGVLVASNNKEPIAGVTYHTPPSWRPAGSIEVRMQSAGTTKSYELRGDIPRISISDRSGVIVSENEHIAIHQFPAANTVLNLYTGHAGLTVPTSIPVSYTSLAAMFSGASTFNQDISMWDTSNITDMNWMFSNADTFNQPIGNWNVSNVTDLNGMFYEAYAFNQDISQWNTSNVTNMDYMFGSATSFNQDLSGWNVINIPMVPDEFSDDTPAWSLPQPSWGTDGTDVIDITDYTPFEFNVTTTTNAGIRLESSGTTADWLVYRDDVLITDELNFAYHAITDINAGTTNFKLYANGESIRISELSAGANTTIDFLSFCETVPRTLFSIQSFNFSVPSTLPANHTDLSRMFYGCNAFNQNLSMWDTSKVTTMEGLFYEASVFNSDITTWNTSQVTNMTRMFNGAQQFNQDVSGWDLSACEHTNDMFEAALVFNQPIDVWDVSQVTNMSNMFKNAQQFNQDISGWNVANVGYMDQMFFVAKAFNRDLSTWNVVNIPDVPSYFAVAADTWVLPKPNWGTNGIPPDLAWSITDTTVNGDVVSLDATKRTSGITYNSSLEYTPTSTEIKDNIINMENRNLINTILTNLTGGVSSWTLDLDNNRIVYN